MQTWSTPKIFRLIHIAIDEVELRVTRVEHKHEALQVVHQQL